MSGAYWCGYGVTFLVFGPWLCHLIGLDEEELPGRVFAAALLALIWPGLLLVALILWRLRVRRSRHRSHPCPCTAGFHERGHR